MFLVKYFRNGFHFDTLLSHGKENSLKVIIYFIVLSLIIAFPLNYLTVVTDGSKVNFIQEDFSINAPVDLEFLPGMMIYYGKLVIPNDETFSFTHQGVTYVFNGKVTNYNTYKNHVFLETDYIIYAGEDTVFLPADGYEGFPNEYYFEEYNTRANSEKQALFTELGSNIEKSFSNYIVLYTVIRNTLITVIINAVFVLLMSLLIQLFRFGYTHFFTFKEGLVFVVMSMALPAVLSFIAGILLPGFGPVVFQLVIGIVIMAVILKFGKKYFSA